MLIHETTKMQIDRCKNSIPHSVILSGFVGSGNDEMGEEICESFLGGSLDYNFDFLAIDGNNKECKELLNEASSISNVSPVKARKRVFLVKNAEKLNPFSQNALLKALEDNNEISAFVFVAHSPLLDTISSRCEVIDFLPLSRSYFGEDIDKVAYMASNGNPGVYVKIHENREFKDFLVTYANSLDDIGSLLKITHQEKEKDPENFFESHSKEDVEALFCYVLNYLYDRTKGEIGNKLSIYREALELLRANLYTKNDFFLTTLKAALERGNVA